MILEAPDAAQANSSSKNTTSSVAPGAAASPTEGAARHDAVLEGSVVVTVNSGLDHFSQTGDKLASFCTVFVGDTSCLESHCIIFKIGIVVLTWAVGFS